MARVSKTRERWAVCVTVIQVASCVCTAQAQPTSEPAAAASIPESRITALQVKHVQAGKQTSAIYKRMAYKSVIREAEALVEAHPAAPNRFRVLGVVLQCQKRLIGLENNDRRYHGQALAYMGLKDWNAALESIEKAIDAQKLRYFPKLRYDKNAANWRKEAATVTVNHPDGTLVELWKIKAEILDKLGRRDEATQMRKRAAAEPARPDVPSIYKAFHEKLKQWRARNKNRMEKR